MIQDLIVPGIFRYFIFNMGGSRISGEGVHMYKGVRVCFVIFSHFSYMYHDSETKLFHFNRIFKDGGGEGDQRNPLSPQWISHCQFISQRAVRTSLQKQLYPLIASPVGSVAVFLWKPFVIFKGGGSSGSAHVLSHLIKYFDRLCCKQYEPRSDAAPLEYNVFSS